MYSSNVCVPPRAICFLSARTTTILFNPVVPVCSTGPRMEGRTTAWTPVLLAGILLEVMMFCRRQQKCQGKAKKSKERERKK